MKDETGQSPLGPDRDRRARALMTDRALFREAEARIGNFLTRNGSSFIDEITCGSRTPLRIVILICYRMLDIGAITVRHGRMRLRALDQLAYSQPHAQEGVYPLSTIEERYLASVLQREPPALLWGQRRLVPRSALDRGRAIYSMLARQGIPVRVLFLGDDDLVSPLLAACAGTEVTVVDIDRAVLDRAQACSRELGGNLEVLHGDVSRGLLLPAADVVVCDPFPSGDGSFEAIFWRAVSRSLVPGGVMFTTLAPSHKPEEFAIGALGALDRLGYQTIELRRDYGRYEVFDFEISPLEQKMLHSLGSRPAVHHTKSLVAARLTAGSRSEYLAEADFTDWMSGARRHYLTLQAGSSEQESILSQRGIQELNLDIRRSNQPDEPATTVADDWENPDLLLLVERAIESWERWRLGG